MSSYATYKAFYRLSMYGSYFYTYLRVSLDDIEIQSCFEEKCTSGNFFAVYVNFVLLHIYTQTQSFITMYYTK